MRVKETPVPIAPSSDDTQLIEDDRFPSWVSDAAPANVVALPKVTESPDAGELIVILGGVFADALAPYRD